MGLPSRRLNRKVFSSQPTKVMTVRIQNVSFRVFLADSGRSVFGQKRTKGLCHLPQSHGSFSVTARR